MSAEIQRFQAILSKHLITSKKFTDEEFTPNSTTSIGGPYSKFPFKRASEINDQVSVFLEGIHPSDIKPGDLNDPYLLSAVACLAEESTLIERLFLTEEANRAGLYAVWLCDNGVWRPIILDDFLPCQQIEGALVPAFAKTDRGEIWVSLLEKAYAKLHGSYLNIESGLCHHAMRDLTGAPVEELFDEKDPERVWSFINSAIHREYFVTCSMDLIEEGDEVTEPRDKGFAYTVLDAREVNGRRGEERLILIRNPRESFDWVGAWSQDSDNWNEKLRNELNYPRDEEASLFWVTLEEYQKNFPVTWVCRYKKDNNYYSVNLTHTHNNSNVLRIIIKERQEVTISLNQHDRRSFKNSSHPDYFYSYARMLLGRVERNGLEYINGNASGYERNLQITHILQPGVYLLTVEVNWNQNYHKNFNVSFYTEGEVKVESLQEVDLLGIQKNIVKSAIEKTEHNKTVTNYGKYGDQDIQKTVDCIHGIFYFHYENQSRKRSKLCETIKFSQISNLKICSPFTNDNQFDVTVLPGSDLLVLYKSVLDDYSWGYSASFYIQGISREDEKTPPNVYAYIDDPDNKTKIEVNNNYNLYVKENYNIDQNDHDGKALHGVIGNTLGRRIEEKAKQSTYAVENFEEDKQGYSEKYYEDRGVEYGHQDQYYYYSDKKEKDYEKSKASVADFLAPKRPKEYPVSVMQLGQTNSKKVKYTNYDSTEKDLLVTSSRPDIVLVKEPKLRVAGGETVEIRLRFHAPKEPGHYGVKVEIRSNKNPNPEEILQFPIEIRYD